eukprot:792567-Prorocentrum_minimum.AAC.8
MYRARGGLRTSTGSWVNSPHCKDERVRLLLAGCRVLAPLLWLRLRESMPSYNRFATDSVPQSARPALSTHKR